MGQVFTRYAQFEKTFGFDLRITYDQSKVKRGSGGNYHEFLNELRILIKSKPVFGTDAIKGLMAVKGINTSKPGLVQVLKGLGIIKKIKGAGHYVFLVDRIDEKLSEFVFSYNHYKQIILNNKKDISSEATIILFSKFEKTIIGKDTAQTKNKKKVIENEVELKSDFIQSTTFTQALIGANPESYIRRKGWGKTETNIRVSDFTMLDWEIVE